MGKICVKVNKPIEDGMSVTFRTPCRSKDIVNLSVTHPVIYADRIEWETTDFSLCDSFNNPTSTTSDAYFSNAILEAILDITKKRAYVTNLNSNYYLNYWLFANESLNKMLNGGPMILTEGKQYGDTLPAPGTKGRIFFKKV